MACACQEDEEEPEAKKAKKTEPKAKIKAKNKVANTKGSVGGEDTSAKSLGVAKEALEKSKQVSSRVHD